MNKTITSMIRIKEKFDILKNSTRFQSELNFRDIPENDKLSNDEIKLLLSTNAVPLHFFNSEFIEERFDEEMLILSLNASMNSAQYIAPRFHTDKTTKLFLEKATVHEFPGTLNPSLISDEDFTIFVEKNYHKDIKKIIKNLTNNFFISKTDIEKYRLADEEMSEVEKKEAQKSKHQETAYVLATRFRNELLRLFQVILKQDQSFDLIQYMPKEVYPELIKFIENNIIEYNSNNDIILKNIPKKCQSQKIVNYAIQKNIANINYSNTDFITTEMVEKMLNSVITGEVTNISDFANKIAVHKDILTKEMVDKIFKMKDKQLFKNIAYLVSSENLTDAMIFQLLQSSVYNFIPDELITIIKDRVTMEQVNLIINKIGIDKLPELEEFIPTEMYQEIYNTEELSEITIQQMGGSQFKNIPKEKQTKRLFLLAINHPDGPLTEQEIITYMDDINPEFISEELICKKISASSTLSNSFIKDYVFPNLKSYSVNLKMAGHTDLWQFINPKFINDEKIILNMILTGDNIENINSIITVKNDTSNQSKNKK